MKKALALTLAMVLCLALAVPAFAAEENWNPGVASPTAGTATGEVYPVIPMDQQSVVPEPTTDAHMNIIPSATSYVDYYYTVQPGDNLAAIAFAFYADSTLATALYQANANGHFLYTKGVLEAYRALRIPAVLNGNKRLDLIINEANPFTPFYPVVTVNSYIWSEAVNGTGLYTPAPLGLDGGYDQPAGRNNQVIYIVKSGDTLKSICATWYNNDADVIVNYVKNYNLLNSTALTVGQYLVLPIITIGY